MNYTFLTDANVVPSGRLTIDGDDGKSYVLNIPEDVTALESARLSQLLLIAIVHTKNDWGQYKQGWVYDMVKELKLERLFTEL